MKTSRRNILRGGLSLATAAIAPEILIAKTRTGYSRAEIDQRAKSGKGLSGLTKADLVTPALILDLSE